MGIGNDMMNGLIRALASDPEAANEIADAVNLGQEALSAIASAQDSAKQVFADSQPVAFAAIERAQVAAKLADIGKPKVDPFAVVPAAFATKP